MRRPAAKPKVRDSTGDGAQIAFDLVGFQVVEADLVTGGDAEAAIERMLAVGLDVAEVAPAGGIGGRMEMQFVEAFLTEGQRAFRAVNLEIVLHLAAGRDPVPFDGALLAIGELREGAAHIVHGHRAHPALPIGVLADHGDAIAHDLGDRAQQELGCGQRVAARRIVAKGPFSPASAM
ncbi:MAG: hypothetical protein U1E41_11480 [Paracoccus sp. (in: a-proteobacteria)]|jgi:hypothetical protein